MASFWDPQRAQASEPADTRGQRFPLQSRSHKSNDSGTQDSIRVSSPCRCPSSARIQTSAHLSRHTLPKDSRTCWGAEAALAGDTGSRGLPPTSGLRHPPSVLTGRQTRLSVSPHHSRRGDMLECSGPAPPPTCPDHPGSSRGRDLCWAARGRSGVKTGHCGWLCKTLSTSTGNQNSERGQEGVM